jgi:hypothetical protein
MSAHALITFTFRWNKPGSTGVFTSAIAAIRIVVLVSPISLPGAAGAETDVLAGLPEAVLLVDVEVEVEDEDEQPAASAITASTAAATRNLARRRPGAPLPVGDLSWPFHIIMVRLTTSSTIGILAGRRLAPAADARGRAFGSFVSTSQSKRQ